MGPYLGAPAKVYVETYARNSQTRNNSIVHKNGNSNSTSSSSSSSRRPPSLPTMFPRLGMLKPGNN